MRNCVDQTRFFLMKKEDYGWASHASVMAKDLDGAIEKFCEHENLLKILNNGGVVRAIGQ